MPKDGFYLTGSAARAYEEQKVPAMFAPLAQATLALHRVDPDDIVLDVACGTGIVVRTIRDRFGGDPTVTGIDLSEGMIDTARYVCRRDGVVANFFVGDATSTPFQNGQFTFVICQQGLQYFPDEDPALTEIRRVGADGARFVFTVWSRPSPLIVALADSLRIHAGKGLATQSLAPFSWTGSETIVNRMQQAGYTDIAIDEIEVNRVLNNLEHSIPKEILGTPIGPPVASMGGSVLETVAADMLNATAHYRHDDQLVIPQHTYVISATAG